MKAGTYVITTLTGDVEGRWGGGERRGLVGRGDGRWGGANWKSVVVDNSTL